MIRKFPVSGVVTRSVGQSLLFLALSAGLPLAILFAQQPAQSTPAPAAQQDVTPSDSGTSTIHVSVNEVSLIFTVTDRHGHYIPNLNQNDFALLDDQKAPAKVNSFHQQINLPLRVGILVDT